MFCWYPSEKSGFDIFSSEHNILSYRHGYHAGKHADVLKHTVQIQCIDYLSCKETPFWIIDTYAGVGGYELDSAFAQKNREYQSRIERIHQTSTLSSAALLRCRDLVRSFNCIPAPPFDKPIPCRAASLYRAAFGSIFDSGQLSGMDSVGTCCLSCCTFIPSESDTNVSSAYYGVYLFAISLKTWKNGPVESGLANKSCEIFLS